MENKIFHQNGFIVKRIDSEYNMKFYNYNGIEGDVWPISSYDISKLGLEEFKYLDCYLDDQITKSNFDPNFVGVITDTNYLQRYLTACKILDFKIEIIFCETERKYPRFNIGKDELVKYCKFLGYDYGYPGRDYYSCVYSDVSRIVEMSKFKLNKYGLFDNSLEILKFIETRNKLEKSYPKLTFELGEFTTYRLWQCSEEFIISRR